MDRKLCIIGPLPPPTHGLSLINNSIINKILERGNNLIILNTSANSLNRTWISLILRMIKMIKTIIYYSYLLIFKKVNKLYISLSGGFGQFYEFFIITISRIFKIDTYIHHHSFAYLNNFNYITKKIIDISQSTATHIVLCELMEKALKKYNHNISTRIISNIAFIENQIAENNSNTQKLTLGFLSNISFEKGIYEFIELFKNFGTDDSIYGIIAGPYSDKKSKQYLELQLKIILNVKYIGSISNTSKSKFFNNIDLLIVPSKNEAEPLVILEAMSYGVPVIARSIGCIPQMINSKNGFKFPNDDDFISKAFDVINKLKYDSVMFDRLKINSINFFKENKVKNLQILENFIDELIF